MKKEFSKSWKASVKPRKQRKYLFNAPLHIKRSMLNAPLSDELAKKHKAKRSGVKKGDTVKVMRGEFKKKEGVVERVDVKYSRVFIEGVSRRKKDGTKVKVSFHPSKLMIIGVKEFEKGEVENGKKSS